MNPQRTRIDIHAGLSADVIIDRDQHLGEVVIAGKSYGFTISSHEIVWDIQPPYHSVDATVRSLLDI